MRKLFAITYPSPDVARRAMAELRNLSRGHVIALNDAVVVTRSPDGGVKLDQSANLTAMGAAGGALWGSLLGLIFLAPIAGAIAGAAAGAIGGYTADYGIDDQFMRDMGAKLQPGTAAVFVLSSDMTFDKVMAALKPLGGEVLYTSLPPELEDGLKRTLAPKQSAGEPAAGETKSDKPYIEKAVNALDQPTS